MLNTLEHTTNPKRTLRLIHEKLRVGGLLFITVPNFDCLKRMKEVCPPKHLFYFTPETLRKMLENVGFRIQDIRTSDYFRAVGSRMIKRFANRLSQDVVLRTTSCRKRCSKNRKMESPAFISCSLFKITSYLSNKLKLGASIEIRAEK
jgi:predicted SAM-dependent methyltransferase